MTRRVAIVSDAAGYVGPALAHVLAERGHDLVVGDPADGLADELGGLGAAVEVVDGVRDLSKPESSERLVRAALDRFGRIDSATAFTGRIVVGRFLRSTIEDLRAATVGCMEAPYNFLRAVVPQMVEQGEGPPPVLRCTHPRGPARTTWCATSPPRWRARACKSTPSGRTSWTFRSS